MKTHKKKSVRKIQELYRILLVPIVWVLVWILFRYKRKNKYHLKKGESIIVLSNHQTDLDNVMVNLSFNRLLHTVATDHIFRKGFVNNFLRALGAIPKRKADIDLRCAKEMSNVLKEGGSLFFFPEGNRVLTDTQFYITPSIGKHLRFYKKTIVLFNLHGGFGVSPKFGRTFRRGKMWGEIKRILKYEDYKDLSDEELSKIIINELDVRDVGNGELYKSNKRAEYLENLFYVCPVCGEVETLSSKGNFVNCSNCGLQVEYTEDLHLKSNNEKFSFKTLNEWYEFEKEWTKKLQIQENQAIFVGDFVELMTAEPGEKRKKLAKGIMKITDKFLYIGEIKFDLAGVEMGTVVSCHKLLFQHNGKSYLAVGDKKLNCIKYIFLFNKLDTKMRNEKLDHYFNL